MFKILVDIEKINAHIYKIIEYAPKVFEVYFSTVIENDLTIYPLGSIKVRVENINKYIVGENMEVYYIGAFDRFLSEQEFKDLTGA